MNILTKRYGCKYKLERAYVEQVNKLSDVSYGDAKSLRELSIALYECLYATQALDLSGQIEREIPTLVRKLPNYLQVSWHKKHHVTLERTGSPPGFQEFVEFVDFNAEVATSLSESKRLHESKDDVKSTDGKSPDSMTTLMTTPMIVAFSE